jgi:VanZ family protein
MISSLLRLLAKVLALLLILILAALMLGPFQVVEQASEVPDYIAHAVAFFLITICLFVLFDGRVLLLTGVLAAVLGGAVEVVQGRVGRDPSWSDFLADIVGIAVAVLLLAILGALIRSLSGQEHR